MLGTFDTCTLQLRRRSVLLSTETCVGSRQPALDDVMLFCYQVQIYKVRECGPPHLGAESEHDDCNRFMTILDGFATDIRPLRIRMSAGLARIRVHPVSPCKSAIDFTGVHPHVYVGD